MNSYTGRLVKSVAVRVEDAREVICGVWAGGETKDARAGDSTRRSEEVPTKDQGRSRMRNKEKGQMSSMGRDV
jgi:hypothetical protein